MKILMCLIALILSGCATTMVPQYTMPTAPALLLAPPPQLQEIPVATIAPGKCNQQVCLNNKNTNGTQTGSQPTNSH